MDREVGLVPGRQVDEAKAAIGGLTRIGLAPAIDQVTTVRQKRDLVSNGYREKKGTF